MSNLKLKVGEYVIINDPNYFNEKIYGKILEIIKNKEIKFNKYISPEDTKLKRQKHNSRNELYDTQEIEKVKIDKVISKCRILTFDEYIELRNRKSLVNCFFSRQKFVNDVYKPDLEPSCFCKEIMNPDLDFKICSECKECFHIECFIKSKVKTCSNELCKYSLTKLFTVLELKDWENKYSSLAKKIINNSDNNISSVNNNKSNSNNNMNNNSLNNNNNSNNCSPKKDDKSANKLYIKKSKKSIKIEEDDDQKKPNSKKDRKKSNNFIDAINNPENTNISPNYNKSFSNSHQFKNNKEYLNNKRQRDNKEYEQEEEIICVDVEKAEEKKSPAKNSQNDKNKQEIEKEENRKKQLNIYEKLFTNLPLNSRNNLVDILLNLDNENKSPVFETSFSKKKEMFRKIIVQILLYAAEELKLKLHKDKNYTENIMKKSFNTGMNSQIVNQIKDLKSRIEDKDYIINYCNDLSKKIESCIFDLDATMTDVYQKKFRMLSSSLLYDSKNTENRIKVLLQIISPKKLISFDSEDLLDDQTKKLKKEKLDTYYNKNVFYEEKQIFARGTKGNLLASELHDKNAELNFAEVVFHSHKNNKIIDDDDEDDLGELFSDNSSGKDNFISTKKIKMKELIREYPNVDKIKLKFVCELDDFIPQLLRDKLNKKSRDTLKVETQMELEEFRNNPEIYA